MPGLTASEAVDLSTFLAHTSLSLTFALRALYLRLAIWSWTPLLVLVHGDVLNFVQLHVLFSHVGRTQLLNVF